MAESGEQLVVRQHERLSCRLPVDIGIAADSPVRVLLSRQAGKGAGTVGATLVDCSAGGVGIESEVYLPRLSRLQLRFTVDGNPVDLEGTVQRASMISRQPKYYLGVSFRAARAGERAPESAMIDRLLRHAEQGRTAK